MRILGYTTMNEQIDERRVRGIAKQIGILKNEIRREREKNTMFFLLGLIAGLLINVLMKLLGF